MRSLKNIIVRLWLTAKIKFMYFRLHTLERLDLSAGCVLMTSLLHIDTCSWVKRSGTRVMEEMDIYPKTGLRIRLHPDHTILLAYLLQ